MFIDFQVLEKKTLRLFKSRMKPLNKRQLNSDNFTATFKQNDFSTKPQFNKNDNSTTLRTRQATIQRVMLFYVMFG